MKIVWKLPPETWLDGEETIECQFQSIISINSRWKGYIVKVSENS